MTKTQKKFTVLLCFGLAGALLMASSDWIMICADPTPAGNLPWLTEGIAGISPLRNALGLALAFPAVILYALGLFGIRYLLPDQKQRKSYCGLTAVSLTPWLALHLFYLMIFYSFSWLDGAGQREIGLSLAEAVVGHFGWMIPAADVLMVLPYLYLFLQVIRKKTELSRAWAFCNPLIFFAGLKLISGLLPQSAFSLAFLNGLMSEAMLLWFGLTLVLRKAVRD